MQERRRAILQELEEYGKVKVAQLSEELNCSEVTIRNDIKAMEKEGLLQRTHGGAIALEQERKRKYSAESIYRHVDRKKAIAASAYEYIDDRDTIILDDASSSFYLALHIKQPPEKHVAIRDELSACGQRVRRGKTCGALHDRRICGRTPCRNNG